MSKNVMPSFAASEAKNNFGKLIDAAQRRPVAVKRHGRTVAFVISPEDMEALEDFFLGVEATAIMKRGSSLGVKASEAFLRKLRHAKD